MLANSQTASFRVVARNGTVFWNSRGGSFQPQPGSLQSIPNTGGTPNPIATGDVRGITTSASSIVWADATTSTIYSANLDGSNTQPITSATDVADVLAIGSDVYWTIATGTSGGFKRIPLAGGAPVDLVPTSNNQFYYLAGDAADVYAMGLVNGSPSIVFLPLQGGSGAVFADASDLVPLAVDGSHLYTVSSDTVVRYPRTQGSTPETLAPIAGAFAVAVDADAAYVTASDGLCESNSGSVYRIPFDTKVPQELASGQACPSGIAVDAQGVYWVNPGVRPASGEPFTAGSGQLMRAPRL